jgi:hypothetical protein
VTSAIAASMLGWALGFAISAVTRTETGPALRLPIPSPLRRFLSR